MVTNRETNGVSGDAVLLPTEYGAAVADPPPPLPSFPGLVEGGGPVGVDVRPGPVRRGEYSEEEGGPGGGRGPLSILDGRGGDPGRILRLTGGERLGGGGASGYRVGERRCCLELGYADDDEGLGGGSGLARGGERPAEF